MKKALLVGINAYPGAPLSGCLNDIDNMYKFLTERYGFSPSDICMLRDGEATAANILAKLEWLIDVKPGDCAFFGYSGHGAQVPTGDHASEPDGLSECCCPVDFDWSPQHMIIDKQFVKIFSRIPSGVTFNWLSDSCHSADLDREMAPPVKTALAWRPFLWMWNKIFSPKNIKQTPKTMPVPAHMMLKIGIAKNKGHAPKGMSNGLLDVGFLSGCKSNQTSADAFIDGHSCGAATYFFLKTMNSKPSTTSLLDIAATMRQSLRAAGYSQEPQAEGARAGRPFMLP